MDLRRAFTMIELMIVVAIVAVLAAILIPNFLHARAESQTSACEGNLKNVATALEEYSVDHNGQYPGSSGSAIDVALFGGSGNPYMAATPADPAGGGYHIHYPGDGVCPSTAAFKILDGDNHNTGTLSALPNFNGVTTGIRWCEGSGLSAALIGQ